MAEVFVDPIEMLAKVKPRVHPKYARKLVQDWLKANTPWQGGWEVSIDNLYDYDSDLYEMSLINPFKMAAEAALALPQEMPKHFDRTHFTAVTIGGRKFVYCPVGNICGWSEGDYDNKWCHWCKKFFSEIM